MKRLLVERINSSGGEIHYILEEPPSLKSSEPPRSMSETEIKTISKKEAEKPLFIHRAD
jgi:hypothetical protein